MKYLFLLLLISCSHNGTDTGNAGLMPVNAPLNSLVSPQICERLNTCRGLDISTCSQALLTAPNMSQTLGVSASAYPNYSDILRAVAFYGLVVDNDALADCQTAISDLSCSDPLVTGAYSSSSPTNFNALYRLLLSSSQCSSFLSGAD